MKEIDVLNVLKNVNDPDIKKDLVTLNMIKNIKISGDKVNFNIKLTTPACPLKEKIKSDCVSSFKKYYPKIKPIINFTSEVVNYNQKSMIKNDTVSMCDHFFENHAVMELGLRPSSITDL